MVLTEKWLQEQEAELEAEAREACRVNRCREFGDCSSQCRYFLVTATEAEKEEAKRPAEKFKDKGGRLWDGPRARKEQDAE